MRQNRQWIGLFFFLAVCYAVAWIGSLVTGPAIPGWYNELRKPPWQPPSWVFGPVWTILYTAMAAAAWLVWRKYGLSRGRIPLVVFAVQLALNGVWTWLFFGMQMPGFAFAEIVVLWTAILATTILFWKAVPLAGWLFVPYLAWVTFAGALNFAIWRLNM